ncbi:antitoxin [Candidatus Gracilibacteria bacterium]|nr:antitoxin [Candidatus Gracilibacteria bacterium]
MSQRNYIYTKEEEEIIDYIENGNPQSIPNVEEEMKKFQQIARNQTQKRKAVSIRLLEDDIKMIKAKSIRDGIPYQTLIASAVHKYANDYNQ